MKNELIAEIDYYLQRLFPLNRSLSGPGNRETLQILQELVPLDIKEYPSGMPVFDWCVPDEWRVRDAWIKDASGNKLVDFKRSNVHLVSYSVPVSQSMSFDMLQSHLYYHEKLPEAIPYRTSYYTRDWGFCVTQGQYHSLSQAVGPLEVLIDSEFKPDGSLSIGELLIKGKSDKEYLISTYICHPSLANDNLSGMVLTAFLARELLKQDLNFSYRIIFVSETIGAITYCANNEVAMRNIDCGFVVTSVGGPGKFGYKQSWQKDHRINWAIEQSFLKNGREYITYPFDIHGSDERQYSSLGFRINVASITKDHYYEYDAYHSSLDDLDFVKASYIEQSLQVYLDALLELDKGVIFQNLLPNCEIMLSKHDLYPRVGGSLLPGRNVEDDLDNILWLLFYCDGKKDIHEISRILTKDPEVLFNTARRLEVKGLLRRIS